MDRVTLLGEDVVTLRPMTEADVADAQALTASFGWAYRREDWAFMLRLGQGIVAERHGRLVGTALAWRYGEDWAMIGLITVSADLQGQGLGRRLTRALLDDLEGRSVALHSTAAGRKLYMSLGFRPTGTLVQHHGVVSRPDEASPSPSVRVRPVGHADLPLVVALDRAASGMDRTRLLSLLLHMPGGVALDSAEGVVGFALVRRFGYGEMVGPVVAPDVTGAKALAAHLLQRRVGTFVRMDTPNESGLGPWLSTLGMDEVETPVRMVRGADVPTPAQPRTFAIASQSLG